MAQIFKDRTIKEKLEKFDIPQFEEKLSIVQSWLDALKNGSLQKKTETECEQDYNQDFFVKILGYKGFPSDPHTIIPKARTEASGQKPDATLGYYSHEEEHSRTCAVVEIKDANTQLDKSQRREGNLSPVQQAFKYKPQYKECGFVIATNFKELRLHQDNQLDYELFTLEGLCNPTDNYFQFRKFYFLLCEENFVARQGKTFTESILSEIRVEQEQITKKFYKQYRDLRNDLIRNIATNNEEARKRKNFEQLAVQKAQKIIDRIVFICFCEDSGLLPDDTLLKVIRHAENSFASLWDMLKALFNAVDKGSVNLGIPEGYNGGLFAKDTDLDSLFINDEVCKKFLEFGTYTFHEDISVTVLGHIFEQSISDIEELKKKTQILEETVYSKRKKDGIFYTPDYITDFIVKGSLGRFLEEKEDAIKLKHRLDSKRIGDETYKLETIAAYKEYQDILREVKVLDPACGSGAFLVKVYDYLLAENKRVSGILESLEGTVSLFGSEDYIKSILQNNIYGVDLNEESVEITKLSLWLKSAKKGQKLIDLNQNIKCGNSIVNDSSFTQNPFNWQLEFQNVFREGGFDVVIGNPPYVRQELLSDIKPYLKSTYKTFNERGDLFSYFYEKGMDVLKPHGILSYISNTFTKTSSGESLRNWLQSENQIINLTDLSTLSIFDGATTYPLILVLRKVKPKEAFQYSLVSADEVRSLDWKNIGYNPIFQNKLISTNWDFYGEKNIELHEKLSKFPTLKDSLGRTYRGLLTGLNDAFIFGHTIDEPFTHPIYEGKDLHKWYTPPSSKYIISIPSGWTDKNIEGDDKESLFSQKFPKTFSQLLPYKSAAEKRFDKGDYWWELRKCAYYPIFEQQKIVWPNLQSSPKFSIEKTGAYINNPAVVLPNADYRLLGILNSKLIWEFLNSICVVRSGGYIEVKPQYLEKVPIAPYDNQIGSQIGNLSEECVKITQLISDCRLSFINVIKQEFEINHISRKLSCFERLSFDQLIKEIGVKIRLERKANLLGYFEKSSNEISSYKQKVKNIEAEIDNLVSSLYGVTN